MWLLNLSLVKFHSIVFLFQVAEFDSPANLLEKESIFKSMVKLANTRTHTKSE